MSVRPGNAAPCLVDPAQPAVSAFGLGMAALIMTIFGFIWLGWGFSVSRAFTDFSSDRALPAARWIAFYVVFLALLGISIRTVRRSRSGMKMLSLRPDDFRSRFERRFRIISLAEGGSCGVVVFLAVAVRRLDLLAAGISLVVGLHFFPLARLFRFSAYYVAGVLIIALDLLSVALPPRGASTLYVCIATGAVLWLMAIYAFLISREFLREATAD